MTSWWVQLVDFANEQGLLGIFLVVAVENLGIPLPTEVAFLGAQTFLSQGRYPFWILFSVLVAGQLLGAILAYAIGRFASQWLTRRLNENRGLRKTQAKVIHWYERYGALTVFATRLIGYVRPWSSFVAGMAEFPIISFIFWTLLGTMIFVFLTMRITNYIVILWVGYPGLRIVLAVGFFLSFFALFFIHKKTLSQKDPKK